MEIFHAFLLTADFSFKIDFLKNYFMNTVRAFRVLISLDQDQAGHFVRPDLGPVSLQKVI